MGISLDEKNEDDVADESNDVTFIMEKDIYDQMGDMKVEFQGNGYMVTPVDQAPSSCGSCSGSC